MSNVSALSVSELDLVSGKMFLADLRAVDAFALAMLLMLPNPEPRKKTTAAPSGFLAHRDRRFNPPVRAAGSSRLRVARTVELPLLVDGQSRKVRLSANAVVDLAD